MMSAPTQQPDGTWTQPGPNGYDIRGHDVCPTCGRVRWVNDHPVDLGFIPDRGVCGELREGPDKCKAIAWDKFAGPQPPLGRFVGGKIVYYGWDSK